MCDLVSLGSEEVGSSDEVVELLDAQRGHDLARLLGDHEEVVDEVLRLPGELLPQLGILRRHAHWAGVQVALPHQGP